MGAAGVRSLQHFASLDVHRCSIPTGMDVEAAVRAFAADPAVAWAEPNYVYTASRTPNDPRFGELWGLENPGDTDIDAPEAWDRQTGSRDVIVAIIDTGVDYGHEDLRDNAWRNPGESGSGRETNGRDDDGNGFVDDVFGWDFAGRDNDPMDDNGHGTHVAGTIAAAGDNRTGVAGVAWSASIMALKFLNANGSGNAADAIQAIEYAAHHGARILNNSWGGGGFSQALHDAIDLARQHDALFVAAAGNSGRDNDAAPEYPASYDLPNVLAVAASDRQDGLAGFSNYGLATVHLAAPGVDILSAAPGNGYRVLSGTSMATPHASGVAALLRAQLPQATHRQIMIRMAGSVDPLPHLEDRTWSGGRLNAASALLGGLKLAFVTRLDAASAETGPYLVEAEALSDTVIGDIRLEYSVQQGAPTSVPMQRAGDDAFDAEIPAQPVGAQVAYFVEAADAAGRTVRSRTYTFQVGDEAPLPGCGVPFPAVHTTQARTLFVLGNALLVLLAVQGGRKLLASRRSATAPKH
jgi:subtilisin family serine protease